MAVWPEDYIEKVVKDVEKYNGVRKVIKAGLIERCVIKNCAPKRIHPNPIDEFSQPDIGPNLGIVGDYVKLINYNESQELPIFKEPLIVQKMEPDGYLLLNGHHRWFAAIRMRVKKIHIQIINLITENDLSRMINKTKNTKLATFDFDEVLLSRDESNQAPLRDSLFCKKIKERLRVGAPEVIKAFADNGYDICVYTASYLTEEDFEDFFSMYELKVDVVVNGINEKRKNTAGGTQNLKEMIREKYKHIAHVDNESVVCTNRVTKNYEIYEIPDEETWEEGIKNIIKVIADNYEENI